MTTMGEMAMAGQATAAVKAEAGKRDETVTLLLTTAEALEWIRRAPRATKFMLHVLMDAPVAGEENQVFSHAIHGGVQLPGRAMLDFLSGGLSEKLEARGGRWSCTARKYRIADKTHVTYWVG